MASFTWNSFSKIHPCHNSRWYFLFMAKWYPTVDGSFCLSIHQLMGTWVISTFWPSWIMLLWIYLCTLCGRVFIPLGYIWKIYGPSGIAGSYSNFMFNLLRSCQMVFRSDYTIPISTYEDSNFSASGQHLLLSVYDDSHLNGCEVWYLTGFGLHFSKNKWCWTCFRTYIFSLEKYSDFLPVFNWLVFFIVGARVLTALFYYLPD